MILVDTSVIIDALHGKDPKLPGLFNSLALTICGVTIAEVLHGARDANHYLKLSSALSSFNITPIAHSTWNLLAKNLYELRIHGITVPFQDALIATIAIENGLELWTRDKQFLMIQSVIPALLLFQEPP